MINISDAITGKSLEYGIAMESDSALQEWLAARNRKLQHLSVNLVPSDSPSYEPLSTTLLQDVEIQIGTEKELLDIFDNMSTKIVPKYATLDAIESSSKMLDIAKSLSQNNNCNLLSLALSLVLGKPMRYCLKSEIQPAIGYWNHFANQLEHLETKSNHPDVVVVVIETGTPVLDISRIISPLITRGIGIILLPKAEVALPCIILNEIINNSGTLGELCSIFLGNIKNLSCLSSFTNVGVIVAGTKKTTAQLQGCFNDLKLDLDGKKAVIAMETADCDAAVEAVILLLKHSTFISSGTFLLVQDSIQEEILWRLRKAVSRNRSSAVLDKTVDFPNDIQFASTSAAEFLTSVNLEVLQVGNAKIVLDAQPSLPLTQWERIGQTALVISYRTVNELISLIKNLSELTELSLWGERHNISWQVINQTQVKCVWVNGIPVYEPGFGQLVSVSSGKVAEKPVNAPVDSGLFNVIDGLLASQKNWAAQGNIKQCLAKFVKKLLDGEKFFEFNDIIAAITTHSKGQMMNSAIKNGIIFDLYDSIGVVSIIMSKKFTRSHLYRILILSLVKGNTVLLCCEDPESIADKIVMSSKEAGIANLISICKLDDQNMRAIRKHHGVSKIITDSDTLPSVGDSPLTCFHMQFIWQVQVDKPLSNNDIIDHITNRRCVWMAVGDGLAN